MFLLCFRTQQGGYVRATNLYYYIIIIIILYPLLDLYSTGTVCIIGNVKTNEYQVIFTL